MNELSWMIYAAEVFQTAKVLLITGGVVLAVCGAATVAIMSDTTFDTNDERAAKLARRDALLRRWWVPLAAVLVGVFVPSASTVYAIAASEMGEKVLNSETGSKAVKALDAWLDKQIEGDE